MSDPERFVIIVANNTSNKGGLVPGPAGNLVSRATRIEGDCACSTDELISVSDSHKRKESIQFEGDCACSTDSPTTDIPAEDASHPFDKTTQFTMSQLHSDKVTDVFSILSNPLINSRIVVLNQPSATLLQSFQNPKTLAEGAASISDMPDALPTAFRLAELDLIQPIGCQLTRASSTSNKTLTAWLHHTDRCNLRCSYCYLPHVREDMSPETGHAAVDAIFRSAIANNFKKVKLKYAGGEPLLRFPFVTELHSYAQSLAEKYKLQLA